MVVSGAPTTTTKHACNIADLALDMIHAVKDITDPASSVGHIKIRIGSPTENMYEIVLL